jgi:hypothetical protein
MSRRVLSFLVYERALLLYPRPFRRQYRDQMLQTLRDAHHDRTAHSVGFWLHAYFDLVRSAFTEHRMTLRTEVLKQPVVFHALSLGLLLTLLGGVAVVTTQQMLRRGADQPQIDMVKYYASEIASGTNPDDAIPPGYVDPERNLEPFVIFYNEQGKPEASTGYLDQCVPTPPAGVFRYVRSHGSENFTWQPRPHVRIAAVVRYLHRAHPGFVLAGRSLRVVEKDERVLFRMTFLGWLLLVLLLASGARALERLERLKRLKQVTT